MRVVLGVTGGVAAFKSLEVLRGLVKAGHSVETVVTANALRFVGKASFEALSGHKCHSDLFEDAANVSHVALAKTDLVLVAPATASFIARYATGIADDLLLNVLLATKARVVIAPAMHTEMWQHPATVRNLEILRERGVEIIGPTSGELTSGDVGQGRLAEPQAILAAAHSSADLSSISKREWVVITAGGTQEPIDDVRFLGNRSTGVQGIELARVFAESDYRVTLIGCNIANPNLNGVEFLHAKSHADLQSSLKTLQPHLLIMNAAVSDFTVVPVQGKIKRKGGLHLNLLPTDDIVADFAKRNPNCRVIAFAAENHSDAELLIAGREKLVRKGVAALVANPVSSIANDTSRGFVITSTAHESFSGTKRESALQILESLRSLNVIG